MLGPQVTQSALRGLVVRKAGPATEFLLADLRGSDESDDRYTKLNCGGFGRLRVFSKYSMHLGASGSVRPKHARSFLGHGFETDEAVRTQVFQLAGCSWRCWYCYVDSRLLKGDPLAGQYATAGELVELYAQQDDRPQVLDLSGGQADLAPEWPVQVLRELEERDLLDGFVLRSEDSLSNDFLWTRLSKSGRHHLLESPQYVRIGCLKGFSAESFTFNTGAPPCGFETQLSLVDKLVQEGFDIFLYATFTGPDRSDVRHAISDTMDRLQRIDRNLPLRVMPLGIRDTPAMARRRARASRCLDVQTQAYAAWEHELIARFPSEELNCAIGSTRLVGAGG